MTTDERILVLERQARATGWRMFSLVIVLLLSGFGVWAATAHLDEVAVAPGEVKPQGRVKSIQHLEGGIVRAIAVREGQEVAEGDELLQIDLAPSLSSHDEIRVRMDGLILTSARHRALATGKDLEFPAEVAKRQPDLVENERNAYLARKQQSESQIAALQAKLRQRQGELAELQSKRRSLDGNLAVERKRFELSTRLVERELTPKLEHLKLEAEITDLEGKLDGTIKSIPRVEAAIEEARLLVNEEAQRLKSEATDALSKAEQEIQRLAEQLNRASDQELRTTVRSPIAGVVKNLTANTIGGVIRPGDVIMEIVPVEETLVVLARLSPGDRGYVEVGQHAQVKVTAYDFYQYGALEGQVTRIAADANHLPSTGEPYFEVAVETKSSYIDKSGAVLPITAGMQATVDIHTGDRSVLTFLLKPFLRLKQEAFRER